MLTTLYTVIAEQWNKKLEEYIWTYLPSYKSIKSAINKAKKIHSKDNQMGIVIKSTDYETNDSKFFALWDEIENSEKIIMDCTDEDYNKFLN